MPLAIKVFEVVEPLSLEELALRLRGYGVLEVEEVEGREYEVGFRVEDLEIREGELRGVFEESFIASLSYRGEEVKVPVSVQTDFRFVERGDRTFLAVAAKKARANRVASRIAAAVSARKGAVIEAYLREEDLRRLYEERPGAVKVVVFTDVRLPDVDKLTLYGGQLAESGLYNEYLRLGRVWYAVFETEGELVVGVARNCVITFFSKIDPEEAFEFVKEKIMPLIAAAVSRS